MIVCFLLAGYFAFTRWFKPREIRQHAAGLVRGMISAGLLHNGDLIFQTSTSLQSKAIQAATHSPYSHCGLIYIRDGRYVVFEAVRTVRLTPLEQWIARGEGGHFVVRRLTKASAGLTDSALAKLRMAGNALLGKPYDPYFGWSDERIYCSELIWKMYDRALGIQIGSLKQLGDFDLSSFAVQEKIKERYGARIPYEMPVISPADMFLSNRLFTVVSN